MGQKKGAKMKSISILWNLSIPIKFSGIILNIIKKFQEKFYGQMMLQSITSDTVQIIFNKAVFLVLGFMIVSVSDFL